MPDYNAVIKALQAPQTCCTLEANRFDIILACDYCEVIIDECADLSTERLIEMISQHTKEKCGA